MNQPISTLRAKKDQIERQRNIIETEQASILRKLRELDLELSQVDAKIKEWESRPKWWTPKGDSFVYIQEMSNDHLINALRVCGRGDPKYTWDVDKARQFADLIREADRRGIRNDEWLYHCP